MADSHELRETYDSLSFEKLGARLDQDDRLVLSILLGTAGSVPTDTNQSAIRQSQPEDDALLAFLRTGVSPTQQPEEENFSNDATPRRVIMSLSTSAVVRVTRSLGDLVYSFNGEAPDVFLPSYSTFIEKFIGLAEERMCLTLVWCALQGRTTVGAIGDVVSRATPSEQPDNEFADKLSEMAVRRLVKNGLLRISPDTTDMRTREIEITDGGRDFAPLASGLLYFSSRLHALSLLQIFPYKGSAGSSISARLEAIRKITRLAEGETDTIQADGLSSGIRSSLLGHLAAEGLIVPVPSRGTNREVLPVYRAGSNPLKQLGLSALDTAYKELVLEMRASVGKVQFNPFDLLDQLNAGDKKVAYPHIYPDLVTYLGALCRGGQIVEIKPSEVKLRNIAPTTIGRPLLRELVDLVDGHIANDPALMAHGVKTAAVLLGDSPPQPGHLNIGETIKKSTSQTLRSING